MKTISLPIKIGKISQWQKGLFIAVTVSLLFFAIGVLFLFFKPVNRAVSEIIDEEIRSTNINFDKKTLDMLRTRQNPTLTTPSSSGKNPFAPF